MIHVRYNQVLEHTVRTYTGTSYSEERELRKYGNSPTIKEAKLLPIDRSDDLVENLEHRRWLCNPEEVKYYARTMSDQSKLFRNSDGSGVKQILNHS